MSASRHVLILGLSLFTASNIWAGDPWKEKPYQEWTAEEVQTILTNSPWALKAKSIKFGIKVVINQPPPYEKTRWVILKGQPAPETVITTPPPTEEIIPAVTESHKFELLWLSALTVRQALVRRELLAGTITAEAGEKLLADRPVHHVLALAGAGIYSLTFIRDEEIQSASLHTRKGKKIIPVQQFRRKNGESGALVQILFYFPLTGDGEATLEPDETNVTFLLDTQIGKLKAKFDLKKMVQGGAPDF